MTTDVVRLSRVRTLVQHGVARSIRQGAGLSLQEMADEIGVAPSTLWRWEAGERTPKGEPALRYEMILSELLEAKR